MAINEPTVYGTPALPYDQTAMQRGMADQMLQQYMLPVTQNVPNTPAPTQAQPQPEKTEWQLAVESAAKDPQFSPEAFDELARQFRVRRVASYISASKMSDKAAEREFERFDNTAALDKEKLFASAQNLAPGQASASGDVGVLTENAAAFLGGVASLGPGLLQLLDSASRTKLPINGIGIYNLLSGRDTSKQTVLADIAQSAQGGIDSAVDAFTSQVVKDRRKQIEAALAEDDSVANTLKQYLDVGAEGGGRNLSTLVSSGLSSLVPYLGIAGKAAKVGKALGVGEKATKLLTAVPASMPFAGQQVMQVNNEIDNTPMDVLLDTKDPEIQRMYATALAENFGDDKATETRFKELLKARAESYVIPTSIAANSLTTLLPGANAESVLIRRALGNRATGGVVQRGVSGLVGEGLQEGSAAALERAGSNLGYGRPAGEGTGRAAAIEGLVGSIIGAGTNIALPGAAPASKPPPNKKSLKGKTSAPKPNAPDGQAQQTQQTQQTQQGGIETPFTNAAAQPMEAKEFESARSSIKKDVAKRKAVVKKTLESVQTAEELYNVAADLAMNEAGDRWGSLDTTQRLDIIEDTLGSIKGKADVKGVDAYTKSVRDSLTPPAPDTNVPEGAADVGANLVNQADTVDAENEFRKLAKDFADLKSPDEDDITAYEYARRKAEEAGLTNKQLVDIENEVVAKTDKPKKSVKKKADKPFAEKIVDQKIEAQNKQSGTDTKDSTPEWFTNVAEIFSKISSPSDSDIQAYAGARKQALDSGMTNEELTAIEGKFTPQKPPAKKSVKKKTPAKSDNTPEEKPPAKKSVKKKTPAKSDTTPEDKPPAKKAVKKKAKKETGDTPPKQQAPEKGAKKEKRNEATKQTTDNEQGSVSDGAKQQTTQTAEKAGSSEKTVQDNGNGGRNGNRLRAAAPKLEDADIADLEEAIALAKEGNPAELNRQIRTLQEDKVIGPSEAVAIRKLAVEKPNTSYDKAAQDYSEDEDVPPTAEELEELAKAISEDEYSTKYYSPDRVKKILATRASRRTTDAPGSPLHKTRLASLRTQLRSGKISIDEFLEQAKNLESKPEVEVRGPNKVRDILSKAKQGAEGDLRKAIELAEWLLDTSPQLASDLSLELENVQNSEYLPLDLRAVISIDNASPLTIVHEILHHAERMLPPDVQNALRTEYYGRLFNKLKQARRNEDAEGIAYLEAVLEMLADNTDANRQKAFSFISEGKVNVNSYYKYFSPSEYWAEIGSKLVATRAEATGWKEKALLWLKELAAKLKQFVSKDTHAAVLKALDSLSKSEGTFSSEEMLAEGDQARRADPYQEEDPENEEEVEKQVQDIQKVGTVQKLIELWANKAHAFEEFVIHLNKVKGKLTFDTNPMYQYRRYGGRASYINNIDESEVVQPVRQWMESNWTKFGLDTFKEFISNVDTFFGNTNFAERIRHEWATNVELNAGKGAKRSLILDNMLRKKISPLEANKEIMKLADQYAAMNQRDFATKVDGMREATYDALYRKLGELKDIGIDKNSMAELNSLLDDVRKRLRQRHIDSGKITKDDPWVDFYNFSWYVPLKGTNLNSNSNEAANSFDSLPAKRVSLGALNRQMQVMEGRKTFAETPFRRLFIDLARAGERAANKEFLSSIYELVLDNPNEYEAIDVYEGNPKDGYINIEDEAENPKVHQKLKGRSGRYFVLNDGDTHYVVTLPKNSQLLRGLERINAEQQVWAPIKKYVAPATYFLARSYTTINPIWQTTKGFVRDITTIPLTVAVENFKNPAQAATFLKNYSINLLSNMGKVGTNQGGLWQAVMRGDAEAVRAIGVANPQSYAALWDRLQAAGGGTEFTQGFDVDSATRMLGDSAQIASKGGVKDMVGYGWRQVLKITGNYANLLEQITRVSSFKTLVDMGYSDEEAAIKTKQVLDYQQSGIHGRTVNSLVAFFRVGMTSVDTMRRAFRDLETGRVDNKKLASWAVAMSGIGMAMYFMASALMGDDEDGKKRIHKLAASTLTQRMLLPIGEDTLGFEIGLGFPQMLLAPGILTAAMLDGHVTPEQAASELYETTMRNGPVRLAGMQGNSPVDAAAATYLAITPTVVAPILAIDRNVNSFDMSIHTTFKDNSKPKYAQARATTADTFVDISKFLYDTTGGKVDMYPEDIKFLAINYGGQNVSDLFKLTIDKAAKENVGITDVLGPLSSRVFIQDEKFYDQKRMDDVMDDVGPVVRKIKAIEFDAMRDTGDKAKAESAVKEYIRANPKDKKILDLYKKLNSARTKRSKVIRAVSKDKLMSIGRKEAVRKQEDTKVREILDELEKAINEK